jgi:hypothetical protein
MNDLSKIFKKKENSEGKPTVDLDREAFRKSPTFSWVYTGLKDNDFREMYRRLYSIYEYNCKLITLDPPLKKPEEFEKEITDNDVLEAEICTGMMFTIGLNFAASALDNSVGRPFIPRDPTTDGSYETAKKKLEENQ